MCVDPFSLANRSTSRTDYLAILPNFFPESDIPQGRFMSCGNVFLYSEPFPIGQYSLLSGRNAF